MTPNPYPLTISAFPTPSAEFVTIPRAEYEALLARIEALEEWRDREEVKVEAAIPSPDLPAMKARVGLLDMRVDDAFEAISEIDQVIARISRSEVREPGQKSAQRIARIELVLKDRGGTASFKTLRRELSLKPNQFSMLVSKLDKRRFVVGVNPRAKDEKFLRLRAFT